MRSGNTTPLCAIEDWSGAGFHTKQPLNVGQPTVSQVVSSPNNQSCLDPTPLLGASAPAPGVCLWPNGKSANQSHGPLVAVRVCVGPWREWEQWAGMANRQVRARFYCHGLEVSLGGGDAPKAAPPGVEPVNPLWSSRFLLMQTHAGYRSA